MVILAAVDGTHDPDSILIVAGDLADAYDTELVVLHVLPTDSFEATRERVTEAYFVDDGAADAADVAREIATSTLDDAEVDARGRVGDPAAEILDLASSVDPAYLVLGGRKRSPVGKALFGSVTQSVLLEATQPVVTVMEREA